MCNLHPTLPLCGTDLIQARILSFEVKTDAIDVTHELGDAIGSERLCHNPIDTSRFLLVRAHSFAPTRNHRNRDSLVNQPDFAREFPAAHPGHSDIRKHAVKLMLSKQR